MYFCLRNYRSSSHEEDLELNPLFDWKPLQRLLLMPYRLTSYLIFSNYSFISTLNQAKYEDVLEAAVDYR